MPEFTRNLLHYGHAVVVVARPGAASAPGDLRPGAGRNQRAFVELHAKSIAGSASGTLSRWTVLPAAVSMPGPGLNVDGHGGYTDECQGLIWCVVQFHRNYACLALRGQDAEAAALKYQDIAGSYSLEGSLADAVFHVPWPVSPGCSGVFSATRMTEPSTACIITRQESIPLWQGSTVNEARRCSNSHIAKECGCRGGRPNCSPYSLCGMHAVIRWSQVGATCRGIVER